MVGVELHTRVVDGYLVAVLCGELDIVDAADTAAALAAMTARGRCVILDISGLGFIDCSSLGALLAVQRLARQDGGDLVLAGPGDHARRILDLTTLGDAFGVHASVPAAVASIEGTRVDGQGLMAFLGPHS